jgi:hypothetical protein
VARANQKDDQMNRHQALCGAAALLSLTAVTPAMADITADDVWSNTSAVFRAIGGTLNGTQARTGELLTVSDISIDFTLPMDAGNLRFSTDSIAYLENGDGTVSILYPPDPTVTAEATFPGEGHFLVRLKADYSNYDVTASGARGDITYVSQFSDVVVGLDTVELPQTADAQFDFNVSMPAGNTTTRVTEGDLLSITMDSEIAPYSLSMGMKAEGDVSSISTGEYQATTARSVLALPPDGFDLMNIAAALRAGLNLDISTQTGGYSTTATTSMNGEIFSNQTQSIGATAGAMRLDLDRFELDLNGVDMAVRIDIGGGFMFPLEFGTQKFAIRVSTPVSASPDPQEFSFALGLDALRLGHAIWAQFDPGKQLPRDPGNMRVDVSGTVTNSIDLFDFDALETSAMTGTGPTAINSLSLNDFLVGMAGAEVTGHGDVTLDNSDLATFGGLPRPTGRIEFEATGANGLLDKLIGIGLIGTDEALGFRLSMGMFSEVVGDDRLRSTIEFGPNGQITANGQRIK